jgi:glycosyltransferase 2 family protein
LKKRQIILGLVALAALVALYLWGRTRFPFDFGLFRHQLAMANWGRIVLGIACIYLAYVFRSVRWAFLLRHNKKVPPLSLLGTQVIGFTAVALIGRVADPVRPYLVAKKTGLPLSNQIAVYIVERLFDAGSMALIFSIALVAISHGVMPHSEAIQQGHWGPFTNFMNRFPVIALMVTRFGVLIATLLGGLFLLAVRLAGNTVATFFERTFGLLSKKLGQAVGSKIRAFHEGLDTMRSFSDFGITAGLSLGMWIVIALAYFQTVRAFVASPQLASMTLTKCVILMMISGGASIFQLPVLGWFTQIGAVAAILFKVFDVSSESATACAATLLLVTFLSSIPIGLIWAQFEHVSLRKVTHESEIAEEELPQASTSVAE